MSQFFPPEGHVVATEYPDLHLPDLIRSTGVSPSKLADMFGCSKRSVERWLSGSSVPRHEKMVREHLRTLVADRSRDELRDRPTFDFIDLFAGIGGMRIAFEKAGGQCTYTCELDSHSRKTYELNFGPVKHPFPYDITDPESIGQIPPHDVLLAGFPCQPFSIAGVSKKNALGQPHGFDCETQGTLFFHVEQIIDAHRPAAFLLENVKNLKSHDRGRTFEVIARTLDRLGYHWAERVIDARSFVPQHRERIFIAGFRSGTAFGYDDLELPSPDAGGTLGDILHQRDERPEEPYTRKDSGRVAEKYTLSQHLWDYLEAYKAKHRAKGNGFGHGLIGPEKVARTLSARYYKDGSEILIKNRPRPRRLTPRECARLMGFDRPGDDRRFKIEVSDTQAYRQFGNSVVVPVVEAVANHMLPHILSSMRNTSRPQFALPLPSAATVA